MVEVCMHFFCISSADLCFSFYYILLNGLDSVRAQQWAWISTINMMILNPWDGRIESFAFLYKLLQEKSRI